MTDADTRHVLIVEDDPEIQYLLGVMLDDDDREILTASTGAEAEQILTTQNVDVVILDLILPDLDGRTLLTRLRERPETATAPVLVVSARGGSEIRQDCFALGADHFTEKPFDPEVLADEVSRRLQKLPDRSESAMHDRVSGLLNRAGLFKECESATSDFGVALVQLDGFLQLGEKWGWKVAEEMLRQTGEAIRGALGERAVAGRLGGGEFAVYERDPADDATTRTAERVLEAIRGFTVEVPDGETTRLTASIGVVVAEADAELEEALGQARRRLFRARESGRNRVVAEDEEVDDISTRVLVAEDDTISATILIHRLEKEGLDVVHYDNGREAYEGALQETPDLVILDIKMPGMDGFEVLERLRRTPSYSEVPIILLTSMGSEADVVRGFQLGADDYVLKPFSPVELSARVWRLLRSGRSSKAV